MEILEGAIDKNSDTICHEINDLGRIILWHVKLERLYYPNEIQTIFYKLLYRKINELLSRHMDYHVSLDYSLKHILCSIIPE